MPIEIEIYILRFSDLLGHLKELCVSPTEYQQNKTQGIFFDGSSIKGFARISESDMRLIPDESTLIVRGNKAYVYCDVYKDNVPFEGDPRFILKKVISDLKAKLDCSFTVAVEPEFHILEKNKHTDMGSYFDSSPIDRARKVKEDIIRSLKKSGINWEAYHHEVGPSHHEIDFKYDHALKTAERFLTYKQIVRAVSDEALLRATFMPKPFANLDGNGLHTNISLLKNGENLFYEKGGTYELSETALFFIGGILKHAKALCAITNPTINSYKRLGVCEAPNKIYWGAKTRDALIRIPEIHSAKAARIEYRSPDATCNPYLAFASILAAGLDGIENKIKPPSPISGELPKDIELLPSSLIESLQELEKDDVIRNALGRTYKPFVELKKKELSLFSKVVTKWETNMYFDT